MFVKHEFPRRQQSPKLAILSKKVTMSLPLVSFNLKGFLLLSMHAKYEVCIVYLIRFKLSLSLLVFYITCNDISVIYVTARQMCRRIEEEVVPTVGRPTP